MADKHGLVSLTENVSASPSTLAARTALDIETALTALTTAFLLKRVRYFLMLDSLVKDEGPFLVGLAQGNASVAEITAGMNVTNTVGPGDVTQVLTQDQAWLIVRDSLEQMMPEGDAGDNWLTSGKWINMPGRGIPLGSNSAIGGIRAFLFNADNAALSDTNTSNIHGIIEYQGVWLRG